MSDVWPHDDAEMDTTEWYHCLTKQCTPLHSHSFHQPQWRWVHGIAPHHYELIVLCDSLDWPQGIASFESTSMHQRLQMIGIETYPVEMDPLWMEWFGMRGECMMWVEMWFDAMNFEWIQSAWIKWNAARNMIEYKNEWMNGVCVTCMRGRCHISWCHMGEFVNMWWELRFLELSSLDWLSPLRSAIVR